jgi:hypothetical protein
MCRVKSFFCGWQRWRVAPLPAPPAPLSPPLLPPAAPSNSRIHRGFSEGERPAGSGAVLPRRMCTQVDVCWLLPSVVPTAQCPPPPPCPTLADQQSCPLHLLTVRHPPRTGSTCFAPRSRGPGPARLAIMPLWVPVPLHGPSPLLMGRDVSVWWGGATGGSAGVAPRGAVCVTRGHL